MSLRTPTRTPVTIATLEFPFSLDGNNGGIRRALVQAIRWENNSPERPTYIVPDGQTDPHKLEVRQHPDCPDRHVWQQALETCVQKACTTVLQLIHVCRNKEQRGPAMVALFWYQEIWVSKVELEDLEQRAKEVA